MVQLGIRVDDKLRDEATKVFQSLGLDMTTAVRMFLTQAVITKSIPFDIKLENPISDEAFQKMVEEKIEGKRIDFNNPKDVEEFFGDEDFSDYEDMLNG